MYWFIKKIGNGINGINENKDFIILFILLDLGFDKLEFIFD